MRLSEAIRLGALLRPQSFHGLYRTQSRGILGLTDERIESCAMGAAFEAAGTSGQRSVVPAGTTITPFRGTPYITRVETETEDFPNPWYEFMAHVHPCPACSEEDALELYRLIPHLNDDHRWTREQIAGFVEVLEVETGEPFYVRQEVVTK